ncbi:GDSL esterase/lipase [Thalictrum thalictroides]|uniref:GDSL esterase/lipase n=1 Tax=Thalictrum thalictroides TaxID=46969 RepID=A0A7J6V6Q5_THATH|nr:GDSL esterase/lipase [Thalictrum thalictroides]
MASVLLLFLILMSPSFIVSAAVDHRVCPFQSLYNFGDSISDVGNLIRLPTGARTSAARLPYGETTFHIPTGRSSNGLLMIDYIAMALRLPLLNPYLNPNAPVDHGVNFAVAGSTALDSSFFRARNVHVPASNSPLSTQLNWFRNHLNRVCHNPTECAHRLEHALVFMGEIGGNDYNNAFFQGKMCGSPGVPVCPNPARRIHWDGIHLTQEAYMHMAQQLIGNILPRIC